MSNERSPAVRSPARTLGRRPALRLDQHLPHRPALDGVLGLGHPVEGEAVLHRGGGGLAGAAFPWRTISGPECSAYWPAGSAAVHVDADVAWALVRYL